MLTRLVEGLKERLARLRERSRPVDTVMTVNERVGIVGGGPLSAALALAAFVSLFPLVLVGIAIVGFVSTNDVNLAAETVDRLGLSGQAAETLLDAFQAAERTRRGATIVGFVTLLWSGLGVVATAEAVINAAWQAKGRGLVGKLNALAWVAGAGTLLLVSIGLTSLANVLPGPAAIPTVLIGLVLDTLLFLWTFRQLANVSVGWRDHLPGAIVGAVGFGLLKLVGAVYVPRLVASSSALYGSIGVVFAVLAWFVLGARLLMYASAYNVVRFERSHGTVTIDIEVPNIEGEVPLEATRGGAVADSP
ncbi:MAG TPA: YihY/virulence factor BrkB family protein [Acidimicrobiales bacterium]|jgi:membrane protein|nr:YihY/virulence factor BrkB family protein [Acidimicrobiales bacterium]